MTRTTPASISAALDRDDLSHTVRVMLELLNLGVEPAEMAQLRVSDVRSEAIPYGALAVTPRRSLSPWVSARRRWVPLTRSAAVAISRLVEDRAWSDRALLVSSRGRPLSVHAVRKAVARALAGERS